jgi:hypothetical protein
MEQIRKDFLARFDAMLADMKQQSGDEIFQEASQHAEDGSLVLDPDDELPRRIDAVTSDGDEYDVEPGEPVSAGSEEEFADYPFKVKTHPGLWEAMHVQIKFQEPLSEGQWEDLVGLMRAWYLGGFWGGYGGYLHRLEQVSYGGRSARCVVDLGSAEVGALHVLFSTLASFAEEMTPIEKVTLGEAPTIL